LYALLFLSEPGANGEPRILVRRLHFAINYSGEHISKYRASQKRSLYFFNWTAGLQCFKFVFLKVILILQNLIKKNKKLYLKKMFLPVGLLKKGFWKFQVWTAGLQHFNLKKKNFMIPQKNCPQKMFLSFFQ